MEDVHSALIRSVFGIRPIIMVQIYEHHLFLCFTCLVLFFVFFLAQVTLHSCFAFKFCYRSLVVYLWLNV